MMKVHAPQLANAYWHAIKSQKPRAAEEILRKANLPKGLAPADHRAARTGKKGRVAKLASPVTLATEPQLRAYTGKKQKLVGFAKAGWAAAAKAIGGRVRRNIREAGGNRRTEEIFPPHIRKLASRFPGAGGARYSVSGMIHRLEIFTNVRYAQEATNPALMASAESRAKDSFTKAIAQSLQAMHKRFRDKAA
jgi:hypothetical protein